MKYLLDTSTLYWWFFFPDLLPRTVAELLSDPNSQTFVSAVSAYEMSYKYHRGRWPEIEPLVLDFESVVAEERFRLVPLSAAHAIRAGAFPAEHRDPFDRMLAAQALVEGFRIMSSDEGLRLLGVEPLW